MRSFRSDLKKKRKMMKVFVLYVGYNLPYGKFNKRKICMQFFSCINLEVVSFGLKDFHAHAQIKS